MLLGEFSSNLLFSCRINEQMAIGKRLIWMSSAYGLKNIVKEARRISETTQTLIYLLAVSDASKITLHGVSYPGISDHSFIFELSFGTAGFHYCTLNSAFSCNSEFHIC